MKIKLDEKYSKINGLLFNLKEITNLPSNFIYSDFPENHIVKSLTDADGRFLLKIPSHGRIAIAAHTSRHLLDSVEEYYWLVWVSLDGEDSKKIILSNNNLMASNSPESVVSNFNIMSH